MRSRQSGQPHVLRPLSHGARPQSPAWPKRPGRDRLPETPARPSRGPDSCAPHPRAPVGHWPPLRPSPSPSRHRANGALSPAGLRVSRSRAALAPRPRASFGQETRTGPRGESGQVLLSFLPFFKAGIQGEAKRRLAEQSKDGPASAEFGWKQEGAGAGCWQLLSSARFPHYFASKSASLVLSLFSKSQTQAMSLNRSNSSSPLRK